MDKTIQILLGSQKNINSVNADTYDKIELSNRVSELMEYDVNDNVNSTQVFDVEREANPIYSVYGRIEYLSLLNGLKNDVNNAPFNYTKLEDFFNPTYSNTSKNINNSFDFYLVRPAVSGYTKVTGGTSESGSVISYDFMIDEKFNNWVNASPTDYPFGWESSVGVGTYMEQTPNNQIKFVLGNNPFINMAVISKNIPEVYGDLILETNISLVSPSFNPATDIITIMLSRNGVLITSFPMLTTGLGHKRIEFNIPQNQGITRVAIVANGNNKSIYMDYFQLYKTGMTTSPLSTVPAGYIRYFQVIATPNDFEIYPAGYSNNVYGEQTYIFSFKRDYDVSQYFDNFNFPATELFLYAQYVRKTNGYGVAETMSATTWNTSGVMSKMVYPTTGLNIGDYVKTATGAKIGDFINYVKSEFLQTEISGQTVYITTGYRDKFSQPKNLVWKYNPFMPLRLRYLANELSAANTGSTSYDVVSSIPSYATRIDNNGNYIWREIVPQGYTEPLTGLGVDYPFLNKRRYLFSSIILSVMPDLTSANTLNAFREIWYSRYAVNLDVTPINDLDNIGKPCQ
jgi:hypothetical protein